MSHDVEVPSLGESISEATLLQWLKREGDRVQADEPLCELESDKATVDLPAPESGILRQLKQAGETAQVGEVIARIDPIEGNGVQGSGAESHDSEDGNAEDNDESAPAALSSAP